jgi:hypothetical protein
MNDVAGHRGQGNRIQDHAHRTFTLLHEFTEAPMTALFLPPHCSGG